MTKQRTLGYIVITVIVGLVLIGIAYLIWPDGIVSSVLLILFGATVLGARLVP